MNKLAIVGAEPKTRDKAPYDDPSYDIWFISDWANSDWAKRFTASIEIHLPKIYENHPRDPKYYEYLKNTTTPVYMQNVDKNIPASVEFPLEDVKKLVDNMKILGRGVSVWNSSVSYLLSLAIVKGYEEIDVYGVEMSNSSEYHSQQPIFAFWVGYAAGKGIKLNINCTLGLFDQPYYGYQDIIFDDKLHSYINGMKEQQADLLKQSNMLEGAMVFARQLLESE